MNWDPLEKRVGRARCVGFMYMGRVNGINLYKHGLTRSYLCLDDRGDCYVSRGDWRYEVADFSVELGKIEAALRELGETLEAVYDEEYIARKDRALKEAGIPVLRIKVHPEDVTVNRIAANPTFRSFLRLPSGKYWRALSDWVRVRPQGGKPCRRRDITGSACFGGSRGMLAVWSLHSSAGCAIRARGSSDLAKMNSSRADSAP